MGFTYDSFDYLAASRSWRIGKELLNANGSLYVFHAPLFPIILSMFSDQYIDSYIVVATAIAFVNGLLLWVTFRRYFSHPFLFIFCLSSIILSVGFQMIHYFLWTESIFLLLLIIHHRHLLRFLESNVSSDFWLMIFIAFLMGLTKNTGFFFIVACCLVLLVNVKSSAFKTVAIYGLLSSLGFVLWNLFVVFCRNGIDIYVESSFLQGFPSNSLNYSDIISQWFIPSVIPSIPRIVILFLLSVLFCTQAFRSQMSVQIKSLLTLFFAYVFIMICFIEVDIDEIERLLAIAAPFLMIAIFLILDNYWSSFTKMVRLTVLFTLMLFLFYTTIRGLKNVESWHQRSCTQESRAFYQINLP